jgi:hypothetical protein
MERVPNVTGALMRQGMLEDGGFAAISTLVHPFTDHLTQEINQKELSLPSSQPLVLFMAISPTIMQVLSAGRTIVTSSLGLHRPTVFALIKQYAF